MIDMIVGAICGALIVCGIWRDRTKSLRRNLSRRKAIADKISMHQRLHVIGDVWTLTEDDLDIIVTALRSSSPKKSPRHNISARMKERQPKLPVVQNQ